MLTDKYSKKYIPIDVKQDFPYFNGCFKSLQWCFVVLANFVLCKIRIGYDCAEQLIMTYIWIFLLMAILSIPVKGHTIKVLTGSLIFLHGQSEFNCDTNCELSLCHFTVHLPPLCMCLTSITILQRRVRQPSRVLYCYNSF